MVIDFFNVYKYVLCKPNPTVNAKIKIVLPNVNLHSMFPKCIINLSITPFHAFQFILKYFMVAASSFARFSVIVTK